MSQSLVFLPIPLSPYKVPFLFSPSPLSTYYPDSAHLSSGPFKSRSVSLYSLPDNLLFLLRQQLSSELSWRIFWYRPSFMTWTFFLPFWVLWVRQFGYLVFFWPLSVFLWLCVYDSGLAVLTLCRTLDWLCYTGILDPGQTSDLWKINGSLQTTIVACSQRLSSLNAQSHSLLSTNLSCHSVLVFHFILLPYAFLKCTCSSLWGLPCWGSDITHLQPSGLFCVHTAFYKQELIHLTDLGTNVPKRLMYYLLQSVLLMLTIDYLFLAGFNATGVKWCLCHLDSTSRSELHVWQQPVTCPYTSDVFLICVVKVVDFLLKGVQDFTVSCHVCSQDQCDSSLQNRVKQLIDRWTQTLDMICFPMCSQCYRLWLVGF